MSSLLSKVLSISCFLFFMSCATLGLVDVTENITHDVKYYSVIREAAEIHGVEPALIAAIIDTESTFNPNAKSKTGAKGLMQLTGATARHYGVTNAYDARQSIMAGTKLLRELLSAFGGNVARSAVAYNAGPGVAKHMRSPERFGYAAKVLRKYRLYAKRF